MTGKTHQVIGQTVGLATYFSLKPLGYEPATFAFVVVVSSVAALLPDIDQPTSSLWRSVPFGKAAGAVVNPFIEHRNLSHSLLGVALVGWLVHWLTAIMPGYWGVDGQVVFWVFMAAYSSHLLADMVTVEGIPLFFPYQHMFGIPPKPFEGLRIVTGKWFENLVVFPLVNIALLVIIISHWTTIRLTFLK